MSEFLDAIEVAHILGGELCPQPKDTRCYTCDSALRDDGVCEQCTNRLGWLNIMRGVKTIYAEGERVEVRAFSVDGSPVSGLFNDRDELAKAIRSLELSREYKAIYATLNPVTPSDNQTLNKLNRATRTTRDADIACRKWLLLDLDPVRASGTNSTDHELHASLDAASSVQQYLTEQGWPLPVRAYSGNGFHLLYRLADLPNTDAITAQINRVLRHLSRKFSTAAVTLDTAVGNASRITKAYGTTPRKGEETAVRPWRGSRIQRVPEPLQAVTLAQLEALAGPEPTPEGKGKGGMHPDFDIEQFCGYFDLSVVGMEVKDEREFHYLEECPFAGRRHSGDQRKTALILGDHLGFKCFSDECDSKGIGDLLRHLTHELNFKPYPHPLFAEREEVVVGGDGEDAEWESKPEPLVQQVSFAPKADEFDDLVEPDAAAVVQTTYPPQPDQSAIPIPDDALYGWLGDKARSLQAPLGWAYPAMLTTFAGQGVNMTEDEWATRPTLYTCLLGSPGDGKSLTVDRAIGTLQSLLREQIKDAVPGSDRGLLAMFAPPKPAKGEPPAEPELKSWLIAQDELRGTLNKIGIQNSSLAPTLCTAFYKDRLGAADKSGEQTILARINLLGCLKCDDPGEFERLFGAETNGGLYDRFIFGIGQKNWKWDRRWRPAAEWRFPKRTELSLEAERMLDAWRDEEITDAEGQQQQKHPGRLAELAARVALISASANHESEVTPACMNAALLFAEWQQQIRAIYQSGQAESKDAECTSAILRKLNEVGKGRNEKGEAIYFRWNHIYKSTSWNRTFGPDLCRRMRYALVQMGTLEEEMTETDPDSKKKEQSKPTGRYRLTG